MTVYCYDTEFLDDGHTIELISIGMVCEDGREYYAVNLDVDEERIKQDRWLLDNVWRHLPLRGYTEKPATIAENIEQVVDNPGLLDTTSPLVKPKSAIANEVRDFLLAGVAPAGSDETGQCSDGGHPELWAYFAAYDHVALAQLWGPMIGLPQGIPMYTHELRQEMDRLGVPSSAVPKPANAHDALADARWNLSMLKETRRRAGLT